MRIFAGLAIGFIAGANWKKLRPHVEPFMPVLKEASEKAGDAYTTLMKGFMEKMEQYTDERAETRHRESQAAGSAASVSPSTAPSASVNETTPASSSADPLASSTNIVSSSSVANSAQAT